MKTSLHDIEVVLLDIEGTVCPITFVKNTLFPYAVEGLFTVLSEKWDDAPFRTYRDAFPAEHRSSPSTLQAHVEDLTKRDVKIAYLKNLQGYLWQAGYESRAYATPLYPDVVPRMKAWKSSNRDIVIYSSGSIFAQKLLFAHVKTDTATNPDPKSADSTEDLTKMIENWFDTTNAGLKTEPDSYTRIADALVKAPEKILFLSDNVREVSAALDAGMKAIVVDRPGNALLSESDHRTFDIIRSFNELDL